MSNENSVGINEVLGLFADFLSVEDILASKLMAQVATSITAQRLALNMTQTQFAEYIGVSRAQESRWERGGCNFSLRDIAKIASRLDLDVDLQLFPISEHVSDSEK